MAESVLYSDGMVSIQVRDVDRAWVFAALADVPKQIPKAFYTAINKTISTGRTRIARRIRNHLYMAYGNVLERIELDKASEAIQQGDIIVSREPVPMFDYRHSPQQAPVKRGMRVWMRKDKGPEKHSRSFLATMESGHTGIFRRIPGTAKVAPKHGRWAGKMYKTGPRKGQPILRQPIVEMYGPTVLGAFEGAPGERGGTMVESELIDLSDDYAKNLASQVHWILGMRNKN